MRQCEPRRTERIIQIGFGVAESGHYTSCLLETYSHIAGEFLINLTGGEKSISYSYSP